MSYLAAVKKEDLRSLCEDLGLTVTSKMSVIAIRDLIINDTNYDEEFTREHLKSIIQNRKSDYEQRMEEIESERSFEPEKLRLSQPQQSATAHGLGVEKPTIEIQKNKVWIKSTSSTVEHENTISSRKQQFSRKPIPKVNNRDYAPRQQEDRLPVKCYGCGTPGFIREKCPNCTTEPKAESSRFEYLKASSCFVTTTPVSTLYLRVNGIFGKACADTGSSHSIAGETLYTLLKDESAEFRNGTMCISLADGQRSTEDVLITTVTLGIDGRKFDQELIALLNAKRNRTLLGTDFLKKSGIMLDLKNQQWFFNDMPRKKFSFAENVNDQSQHPVDSLDVNLCTLREEGRRLNPKQKDELVAILKKNASGFEPGGDLSSVKKEFLKKELDKLLEENIIEECESPYAAPVVLVPKPNGDIRLCIDYTGFNATTIADSYPLPRMDDLLHAAKHTPFMITIDLKSGNHQISVCSSDRDKTAFMCPFGTFLFLRMPFGLKTAPATFQRLIDKFRSGLKDMLVLSYLYGIIVLSETFEKHLDDLKAVFERLLLFKMQSNRNKCNFACERVKYLGHYITSSGVQVDPDKTAAIRKMVPPKNVKQVQSFQQTCSWYRRFNLNFAEKSRPLSNLTKRNALWKWEEEEQKAFNTLTQCLTTASILKQMDDTKHFIIRTDAGNYSMGTVLLQGLGAEKHPLEYASRLLNSAERSYSTTEREELAVVWALNKFRGYVEGSEITVASDHQQLK
ncbi:Retrovirus-related Pol polyprotein from transposon 17.6 [Araneus ventricosus]|uniref:RNA-directed DNA polymerase n=1 Tax=Araneus ventricosus TaxID=182803 RepID=A0A4Y2JT87_ARAVE|nr:Retrovirus-related Pol polyprotein from transposon 17.6 [Araneus ventricosus]